MAENRKDNDGLYYFSKTQLVIVGTGFTATCVLIFLLGILIGQGVEERKLLKQEGPLVKVPLAPLAPGSKQGSSKDELTFYDTLAKAPSGSQPAKELKAAEKAAKADVKETKPELKEAQETKPAAKEIKIAKSNGSQETPATAQKAKEKAGAENAAATEVKKPATSQKTAEKEKTKTEPTTQEHVWTVQVNATPDERSAQKLVERLKQKGYDAYMVTTNQNGRDWYRVRAGRLPTRGQAQELLEDLQTKENLKPIIVGR